MNLENVTVEMRPRGEWEAADLGVRMIRRDAAAIYRVWFAITLPLLALAMAAVLLSPWPALAAFAFWWLEPVADGPILRIISRRLFGEDANVRAALRDTFRLAWRNRIFLVSPYRFHFARSTAMPLTQLEGLSGAPRRARAKVLNLRILNYGTGVTLAYQHLALALYFGVILIGFVLVPTALQDTFGNDWLSMFFDESGRSAAVLSLLAVYFAQTALQPWFVGAGFGLYINCRTQLEAWDIEVAFRRMVQRRTSALAATVLLAVLLPVALLPEASHAEPAADAEAITVVDPGFAGFWEAEEVTTALKRVMDDEALQTRREVEDWQAIEPANRETTDDAGSSWWVEQIEAFGRMLAYLAEFGLWIAAGILLLLLFATRKRWLPYLDYRPAAKNPAQRIVLAGGELTAESLPRDIPAEAMRLWRNGEKRNSLSLLYRGSVYAAVTRYSVRLPRSATEGDCLAAVGAQTEPAQSDYFKRVVFAWIRCAYAFRDPDDRAIVPLCAEWPQHYGDTA